MTINKKYENLNELRELLISAMHSNTSAEFYFEHNINNFALLQDLCTICAPYDEYSNDPRMQAAHYIEMFPEHMLVQVLPTLLVLVSIPSPGYEYMNGNIAAPLLAAIEKSKHLYKSTIYQDLNFLAEHFGITN
jgi:hypothetical protein